jgi:hypothetical protein
MPFALADVPSWHVRQSIERALPLRAVGVTSAPEGLVAVT